MNNLGTRSSTAMVAVIAVAVTYLGISNLPGKAPDVTGGTPPNKVTSAATRESVALADSACAAIQKRLSRLIVEPALPDSCYPDEKPQNVRLSQPASPQVRFVIAIVPNPVTTHLSLLFDRSVEIIQQAAQDELYSYDSSWLPWTASPKEYALLADQDAADRIQARQERQPGILVFRGPLSRPAAPPYQSGLIVLLVSDQPTGGISDAQFENAVAWIARLQGDKLDRPLTILGPTFSGSLPSLARELLKPTLSAPSVSVTSGTVSSQSSYVWFRDLMKQQGISFSTFMESDTLMIKRFCNYLSEQQYRLDRVAVLSEDETAFGKQTEKGDCYDAKNGGSIYLYYPRDIASLRSAYEKQLVFSSGKQQAQNAPTTTLRGDLSEPGSGDHDTVRTYGGQLTPLAQESTLLGIVSLLREKQIEFVIVRSSNSLDQIFLAQFLKRAYPSGRVVLDGTDLLFRRGGEGASLRGVMLLSPYPLTAWQEINGASLRVPDSASYRVFGQDIVEGLYVAARQTFNHPKNSGDEIPIRDYAAPPWIDPSSGPQSDAQRPPTWLSVIGSRQFWPVAALNDTVPHVDSLLQTIKSRSDSNAHPLRIPAEMVGLIVLCVGWTAWHLFCCWRGSVLGTPRVLAYFAPVPNGSYRELIFVGSVLLGFVTIVLGACSGFISPYLGPGSRISLFLVFALMLAATYMAMRKNNSLPEVSAQPDNLAQDSVSALSDAKERAKPKRLVTPGNFLWVIVLFTAAHYFLLIGRLRPENEVPTYWRSVHIFSGVSPLVPQVLLIAGLYLWVWFNLQGRALFGQDRPMLPGIDSLPKDDDGKPRMPMFSEEQAAVSIEEAGEPLSASYLRGAVILFGAVITIFSLALHGFLVRSLGERAFGQMILLWLSVTMAIVLADTLQLVRTWGRLHQLLIVLDRIPLRRTLCALKGLAWGSVWKMSGNVLEERYRVMSRQFESLRHLRNSIAKTSEPINWKQNILGKIDACLVVGMKFAGWYVGLNKSKTVSDITPLWKFQKSLAATAGYIMGTVLIPAWQSETESLIFDRSRTGKEEPEGTEEKAFSPSAAVPDHVRVAEEFFLLPYIGFIQNILGRIRTIVMASLCVFVAATFAVSSYPFDPRPVLAGVFLVVFGVAGAAVIFVYAEVHRDATLSYITNTRPGELGSKFWIQLVTFGLGPLIGLLTTLFPSITDFVASWLEPGIQAIK